MTIYLIFSAICVCFTIYACYKLIQGLNNYYKSADASLEQMEKALITMRDALIEYRTEHAKLTEETIAIVHKGFEEAKKEYNKKDQQ